MRHERKLLDANNHLMRVSTADKNDNCTGLAQIVGQL
jgi:hypothetical protein